MTLPRWLNRLRLHTPAAVLLETYRPLSFWAGEMAAAAAPLLPVGNERVAAWGERLSELEDRETEEWLEALS